MGRTAFLDLREKELSVTVFDYRGTGAARNTFSLSIEEGSSFEIRDLPADISVSFLSLPLSILNFRIISLPFDDLKKVRDVVPFEIDGLILGGAGSVVFDSRIIGHENGRSQVLVAYVAKELVKSLLDRCRNAGLDPGTVTCLELGNILSARKGTLTPELLLAPAALADIRRKELMAQEMREPTLNFRKGEFAHTADEQKSARSLRTAVVLALLIVISFLSFVSLKAFVLNRENRAIRDDIRKTYVSLFPQEKKVVNELLQLKSHMKELQEKEQSFVGVAPLRLLLDLSKIQRPEAALSEITIDRDLTVFKGECPSLSDVQGMKKDLEGYYAEVTITDTKPSAQNRTAFTIAAKGRKG